MVESEFAVMIIPGLFFILMLGLMMQFLKSRDMKAAGISQYTGITNLLLMLFMLVLFLIFAMVIVAKFML